MRELTKQQKIKVIDKMIVLLDQGRATSLGLCAAYDRVVKSLKYKIWLNNLYWTSRFKELDKAIESEIARTGNYAFIEYENWTDDRIDLLKKVKKELC